MYLESIALLRALPCLAEPGKIIVIGRPNRALTDVIPYLASLPGVIAYHPETCVVTFRRPRGFMTLYPNKVYITQVDNSNEGLELLKTLVEAINTTWDHRAELKPISSPRRAPRPLDIWMQLPQTNCKRCGEETCLAFACNLLLQNRVLDECEPLKTDPSLDERRAALEALF
jgi:ArsR family metal-binding transcriptional regulator